MIGKSLLAGIAVAAAWPLLAQTRLEVATWGTGVLQHTDIARQALAHRDAKAALTEIRQALSLADKIKAPSIALSSDFDAVATKVPVKHRSSVSAVNGSYTATILNVTNARNHLLSAQSALDKGDLDAAEVNLVAVQGDVAAKSYTGDLPLVQAKDNLDLALARIRDGKYKDAILPLKSASRALDRFAHQSPAPRASAAKMASRFSIDIDAYAERIAKDHVDAPSRISGWLDKVNAWFYSGMAM
jgi:hypothetical protein